MTPKMVFFQALTVAIFTSEANAIGFGEIALHSRVGENLRAEIPLHTAPGERPEAACFKLLRDDSADLPVVTQADLRIVQKPGAYYLSISGPRPIVDPAFVINIKAGCDMDLQRTYVLIPEPPTFQPVAIANLTDELGQQPDRQIWLAREGETLSDIAAGLAAGNTDLQARQLAALRRANPGLGVDELLAEGMVVRLGKPRRQVAPAPSAKREAPPIAQKRPGQAAARLAARTTTPTPVPTADRLIIGAAPTPGSIGEPAAAKPDSGIDDIERRILKLERTLHALNSEMEKLDAALIQTNTALLERNRLQLAQQIESPALRATLPTSPASGAREILFGALGGGISAVLLAHFLGRRQERRAEREMPLLMNGYHPEICVNNASALNPPEAFGERYAPPNGEDIGVTELEVGESSSELELVELLLASGRQRGAAEALARHIDNTSPDSIQPWKKLVDLYRRCNMRAEFEALRPRILEKFKTHLPDWDRPQVS